MRRRAGSAAALGLAELGGGIFLSGGDVDPLAAFLRSLNEDDN